MPPKSWFDRFRRELLEPLSHAEARQVLLEAGWGEEGDAFREPGTGRLYTLPCGLTRQRVLERSA